MSDIKITEGADPEKQAALYAALAKATASARAVEKGAENTYSRYKYASAEAVVEEARAHLAAEGIAVVPKRWRVLPLPGGPVSGGGKASMYFADVEVLYKVTHAGGGWELCEATTPAVLDNGRPQDKAVATALTYSLGYFLRGLLMLPRVDAADDVDQRDDRDFEPPRRNGNGRPDARQEPRPASSAPPSPATAGPPPSRPTAPAWDIDRAISEIRAAPDMETLRMLRDRDGSRCPKSDAPRVNAEWMRRAEQVSKPAEGRGAAA